MKARINHLVFTSALFIGIHQAAALPVVGFTQPTNGQQIVTFSNIAGTAQANGGTIQRIAFSIFNQSSSQWWNGTNFQGSQVKLPVALTGTNWVPAAGLALPQPCCSQNYQLQATVTNTDLSSFTTNIIVQADSIPPVVTFAPLANGQTVSDLTALGGDVTDNFGAVASVVFNVHEQDINGGPGRWWNGTNFQNSLATLPASVTGTNWSPAPAVVLPQLNSGQKYDLTVTATDTTSNSSSLTITVTNVMTVLTWDPGQTPLGTMVLNNPNTNGGNYWFQVVPQSPTVGVWRTALNVLAGQAGVYMSQGSPPNIYSHQFASANVGANGFVLDASQFQPAQNWYILVNAATNAQWNLVTGDAFVYNLGSLATDSSSSTNATIGAEGMIFYQTTIPSTTLAWQLWMNGAPNMMYVKKSVAPDTVSHDLAQTGQMLVVPPYLASGTFNGSYFISVPGSPGTTIQLDSRQQPVTTLAFGSLTNVTVTATNFPYVTYQVQVPVQQIAWQLNLTPASGNPSIAVRLGLAPNEFRNDAFSEPPQNVGASVSLVPPPANSGTGVPGLSDGSWYVTIYSTNGPYSCAFTNANPVITPESYVFQATNDTPNRTGWRYYVLTNINQQLGSLGWQLSLANQVSGTEIAIRRNAVPGQWSYRNGDNNYNSAAVGYVDLSNLYGLLQQPGHQADIWYVGVYTPNQALGSFVLNASLLTGQPLSYDGAGGSVSVTNQLPGQWGFFQVTVPSDTNLLGWDIRLEGVTAGNPQMVVSRDTLPTGLGDGGSWNSPYNDPAFASSWPSGNQWLNADWTGCGTIRMLAMGMGNPLQPGTYYIGVQDPNNTSSYTLQSRGIGLTNYSISLQYLAVTGSATNSALPSGQADYYQVMVPSNAPDWKLHLSATTGEVLLKVQRDYLPNIGQGGYGYCQGNGGGQLMMKPGDEQWSLLPSYSNGTNLLPGTYYVAVVSQGQSLTNSGCSGPGSGWGSGSSSYTLTSLSEPVTQLPATLSYGNDLLFTNSQAGGELKFYQFSVPPGTASIQVRLENQIGVPLMYLNQGTNLVGTANSYGTADPYGNYGGTNWLWSDASLITIANPTTNYSLSVYATTTNSTYVDASYVLRVRALPPPLVAFDGGTMAITNQPAGIWQFFQINVPSDTNLFGWDIRLVGVTAGNPRLVVCRDTLPTGLVDAGPWNSPYNYGGYASSWPSGCQWLNVEWTGCGTIKMLAMGIGNPLQPGTYYIGVQDPVNASSYTLQSRGIGFTNYTIPVQSLAVTGSITNLALPAGEAAYYQVTVPSNAPDWKLHLNLGTGDALMKIQQGYLPNSANNYNNYGAVYPWQGGQLMMKPGTEQWALLPSYSNGTNLLPGTYYVAVVSQGQNLMNTNCNGLGSGWGSGSSSFTLTSVLEPTTRLPATLSYTNDLLFTNSQAGGEMKFYQFNVPSGIPSIETRLENRVGNPVMYLNAGTNLVGTDQRTYYWPDDGYGNYAGTNFQWTDGSLITVVNPTTNYSLTVFGQNSNGYYPDVSYVLRVRAVPPPSLTFDGGTISITNQPVATWQFFQVTVPADTNLLGWDIRLTGVTAGNPQMVVCRDTLPNGLSSTWSWGGRTSWPSGYQWEAGRDWTGCGGGPMLEMGMGNPLQPGTYYIGVQDPNYTSSYTVESRGIGQSGYTIPVNSLDVSGSVTNLALPVGEADYYQVTVPSNAPDWKLHLSALLGDVLLMVQQNYLPNPQGGGVQSGSGGQLMMKPGDEQWALMPYYNNGTNLLPGTYYVLVASQGQNLTNNCEGGGSSSYTLDSLLEPATVLPATLSYGNDLLFTNSQAGGEMKFYQFNVPSGIASVEVSLEDRVGNPLMFLNGGTALVHANDSYGNYGGSNWGNSYTGLDWLSGSLITIPNVPAGAFSLSVYGARDGSGNYADASYLLQIHAKNPTPLSFSSELNTGGLTNVASGLLADKQHDYYQVTVPASVNGAPVLGWNLVLTTVAGSPSVRVRQNLLPDSTCDTTGYGTGSINIVPPYLTPGTWYVDVVGSGSTTYSLTSRAITTNDLAHSVWVMPSPGQSNSTSGLTLPMIGDSGVDTNGNPLPGDQGTDLKQGQYDFYAVIVPTNNAGVLRTELQAISGNPNLYLRVGAAPTLDHTTVGSCGYAGLYDRLLNGGTTEYGNWVPLNGRYQTQLTNGLWVLAVQASGNANARYRLQLSCGNSVTNGLVQDFAMNGGSFTNQNLTGGDWRYYRVQIPDPAPTNWQVTFSRTLGSARMFVRDTVPPGDGSYINPGGYANSSYNPGQGSSDLQTWNSDDKNQGPYPRFDSPGTYILTTPPLRPGAVYYLGFWSSVDTTFSVSSATNGGTVQVTNFLAYPGGTITNFIPGHGTLMYRMDVPPGATRILFNASNTSDILFSLEQGTLAQVGGPAHWVSSSQANVSLNQPLFTPNAWPWLPGFSYYLAITNTSANAEYFSVTMSLPADLSPVAFVAPTNVASTQPNPTIKVVWGVTNVGTTAAAGSWYDRLWFSTSGVFDANSIDAGDWYNSRTVPAGGSYWLTNNATLPMSASGTYTLFVQVDVNNSIYGANLGDKVSAGVTGTFTLIPPQPSITSISLSGANLIINGSSGVTGKNYTMLMSTNLTLPLIQWTPVTTNSLNASGNFTITATNAVSSGAKQQFYILQVQ